MAVIRWEPVAELNTIQNEMNRLLNTLFHSSPESSGGGSAMRRWIPPMDLVETQDAYVLRADLPGLSEDDVNIEVQGNTLTISGERRAEHEERDEGYYRVERAFGAFSRSLTLPEGVDPDSVQARFERGVLEVRIPKPEQRKARKVEISVAGRPSEPGMIEGTETRAPEGTETRGPDGAQASEPVTAGQ